AFIAAAVRQPWWCLLQERRCGDDSGQCGDGVGCVVVVPAVERQRSGVGGGVVLAAWVVVLAVGRRTLPEKWRWRVKESGVEDRVDRETRNLFGFVGKILPEKFSGGGWWPAGGRWPAAGMRGEKLWVVCVLLIRWK
nr:hypothetical protein [Tanacetum cinerariifolium]